MSKNDIPKSSQPAHAVFSFFSGAGFLDLGFDKSGFEIAFANALNAEFVQGYRHSRAKMGLSLPRYGIACDSIDDHLKPYGASALTKQITETRKSGQTVGFIGGQTFPWTGKTVGKKATTADFSGPKLIWF